MASKEITRADINALTRKLIEDGRLIAAGFLALRLQIIPLDAPQAQVDDMEFAYLAGAQHVWASIFGALDADADATPGDLRRMQLMSRELDQVKEQLKARAFGRPN